MHALVLQTCVPLRQPQRRSTWVKCQSKTAERTPLSRRHVLAVPALLTAICGADTAQAALARKNALDAKLNDAFNKALRSESLEEAENAWSEAVDLAPDNSAVWSNRGTIRLQMGKWGDAKTDLEKALSLEEQDESYVSAILLVNLANAEGALGDWDSAMEKFVKAGADPDVGEIARANHALALFQVGKNEMAISEARNLIRKDPGFLDMRCALAAFLWASGLESEAEAEYNTLQNADDGVGAELYGKSEAIDRVKGRWPPRPTAALDAYLKLKRSGSAEDYDGSVVTYNFL